ncbi:heterokaryon incompatibility protein-domain-containing protein, partial [Pyrenochaeta sp. MPI-SDFR-AT-0127]
MDECELVYRYLPILADQDMRVLKLEPALHYNDPLVASLFSRPIQDDTESPSPTYQCISYCWGIFEKSGWLICDNQRLSITANVDAILRHLRKASKPRNLWIDTLCINQADDWEKANQVRSMGRIYKRADKVHIWLGTANDKDCIPSVFAIFREQVNTVEQLILTYESTFGHISPQMVAALLSFFDRPWFNRRWVLQEVVLAHSATVHCGHHTLSWNWVREAVAKLHSGYLQRHPAQNNPSFPSSVVNAFENVALLEARRVDEISILQLLWNHHASECADARDRLFALYAMVPATLRNALNPHEHCPVNYTENFALLYTKLAAAAINTGFGLTILNHALAFGSLEQQDP